MSFLRRLVPGFFAMLAASALAATPAPDWTQLREGMAGDEALAQLGEPLFRMRARGFELWIYDGRGEVLLAGGPVKAWTVAEPTAESLERPVAQDVLIRPAPRGRRVIAPATMLPRPLPTGTTTRFRYL